MSFTPIDVTIADDRYAGQPGVLNAARLLLLEAGHLGTTRAVWGERFTQVEESIPTLIERARRMGIAIVLLPVQYPEGPPVEIGVAVGNVRALVEKFSGDTTVIVKNGRCLTVRWPMVEVLAAFARAAQGVVAA